LLSSLIKSRRLASESVWQNSACSL